jgi:hypothetical protein
MNITIDNSESMNCFTICSLHKNACFTKGGINCALNAVITLKPIIDPDFLTVQSISFNLLVTK